MGRCRAGGLEDSASLPVISVRTACRRRVCSDVRPREPVPIVPRQKRRRRSSSARPDLLDEIPVVVVCERRGRDTVCNLRWCVRIRVVGACVRVCVSDRGGLGTRAGGLDGNHREVGVTGRAEVDRHGLGACGRGGSFVRSSLVAHVVRCRIVERLRLTGSEGGEGATARLFERDGEEEVVADGRRDRRALAGSYGIRDVACVDGGGLRGVFERERFNSCSVKPSRFSRITLCKCSGRKQEK